MKTHQLIALGGLAALLVACGAHDTAPSPDYATALEYNLDALNSEQVAHSSEISATTRVELIGPVELGHTQRFDDRLAQMSRVVGGMMSCTDDRGLPLDAATLAALTQDLRTECDEHDVLMLSAHDMETARAEEARHQYMVGKQMDKMRRQMSTMMQPGSGYNSCSPCPSCGM
jgi:hypothetical protein